MPTALFRIIGTIGLLLGPLISIQFVRSLINAIKKSVKDEDNEGDILVAGICFYIMISVTTFIFL